MEQADTRIEPLDALFAPRSIAVIGASANPSKAGFAMTQALARFEGAVFPVNPRETRILGRAAYPHIGDVPARVDLAILTVPAVATPAALRECAAGGVRAAVVCAGGFAESGAEGRALQDALAALARESGMRLLGPNTSGFLNPALGLAASFVPGVEAIQPGRVAIVAQSGGVNHALAFLAHDEGLGLRLAVGLGNAVDVGFADLLDYLAADDATRAVALHVEGVADGRRLFETVARVTRRKPVVALVVGRADVRDFARSHTGALMGDWTLTRAALAQAGAVVVSDTGELLDAARTLALTRLPPTARPRVGVVTGQAGPGLLIADLLRASAVETPPLAEATRARLADLLPPITAQSNPVDTGRPDASFGAVLATVAADADVDAVLAYALHEPGAFDSVEAARQARATTQTPLVIAMGGLREPLLATAARLESLGVPLLWSPERGARAMRALVADARAAFRAQRSAGEHIPPLPALAPLGPEPLDEDAAKTLLARLGVRTPARRVCATREEAWAALAELGAPVVVKALAPALLHKSEAGGVVVGVATPAALEAALDGLDRLRNMHPNLRYLIEAQAPGGPELIVGARRDASFGPVALLGLGGVAAEALGDVTLRVAPLSMSEAFAAPDDLAGAKLLDGFRGQAAVDRAELARILVTLGALLAAHPEVAELEINPLRATRDGLLALDALVALREPDARSGDRAPREFEGG